MVASEQKATEVAPSMRPIAASMPESSSGVISSTDPGSKSWASRAAGLRGSSALAAGLAVTVVGAGAVAVIWSDRPEREGDVVAAEAEGVVEAEAALGQASGLAADHVEGDVVVDVVQVGRRGGGAVVQREDGRDRLHGTRGAEQVAGHRL